MSQNRETFKSCQKYAKADRAALTIKTYVNPAEIFRYSRELLTFEMVISLVHWP